MGETQISQYIAELLEGNFLENSFQCIKMANLLIIYLMDDTNEKSFVKDLLGRDSNVILLVEFDKA